MGETKDDDRSSSGAMGPVCIVGVFLLLPILYVLSTGPAVMLRDRGFITQDTLRTVYAPIFWLSEYEIVRDGIEWYCEFWA